MTSQNDFRKMMLFLPESALSKQKKDKPRAKIQVQNKHRRRFELKSCRQSLPFISPTAVGVIIIKVSPPSIILQYDDECIWYGDVSLRSLRPFDAPICRATPP